jgi:molecular chaperone DnaK (HSP70)
MWQDARRRYLLRLGIDFGTTRTVVAFCDRGNYPVVSFADEAGDASECFPSVVAARDGELRFGFEAERLEASAEWTTLRSFKRLLNDPSPEATIDLGGGRIRLVDLLALFLANLGEALRTRSNVASYLAPREKLEAFVAAPANAHSTQRFVCLDAFRRAGFEVLGLLNEPSAAGFEYTHRYRNTLSTKKDHVVVYDIGGGTFDVSMLRMSGPLHEVVTTSGINRLGGDDFDDKLLELALIKAKVSRSSLEPRAERLLLEQCRRLKEQLHPTSRRLTLDLASCLGQAAPRPELSLEVSDFYDRCAPLVERTITCMSEVMEKLEPVRAADEPKVPAEIAGIYVVGGASSLPTVGRALRERFGKKVHRSPYPSAAAAIGLAIAADANSGMLLTDKFSRVFGVFREGKAGREVTFDPIFDRDIFLPDDRHDRAVVERTYRAAHNVGHFRYVECGNVDSTGRPRGDMASFADIYFPFDAQLYQSKAELGSINVERFGDQGPLIRETYAVNAHGIVEVRIANLDDHYEFAYRLCPERLSPHRPFGEHTS